MRLRGTFLYPCCTAETDRGAERAKIPGKPAEGSVPRSEAKPVTRYPSSNQIGSPKTLYFLYDRADCTNTCTMANLHDGPPAAQGLYDPHAEHDACGVGF